jgi:cobyrinic acid a,c-diamide synthase
MAAPRILVSAASSGAGKTSVSLGLMAALSRRGLRVQPCKTGPDFIDMALHARTCGRPGGSFDPVQQGRRNALTLFARRARDADVSVIEGAMGYYDGSSDSRSSSFDAARLLKAPAILVLDARAASESLAAVALGFLRYRRSSGIRAFLLNRVGSPAHAASAGQAIERATGLPVLGALPWDPGLSIPERHLGLTLAGDNPEFDAVSMALGEALERYVDLDALLAIAAEAPALVKPATPAGRLLDRYASRCAIDTDTGQTIMPPARFRLGVARDEAFSFYYQDNLDILEALGAELVFFSPLRDPGLPRDIDGVYLGGGYPELHGQRLSANAGLHRDLAAAAAAGLPIWAECGGYMFLCRSLEDREGRRWPMAGLVPWSVAMTDRCMALGYHEGRVTGSCGFLPDGMMLTGHCFHWSRSEGAEESLAAIKLGKPGKQGKPGTTVGPDGYAGNNVFATYLHIHFAGNLEAVQCFADACTSFARQNGSRQVCP